MLLTKKNKIKIKKNDIESLKYQSNLCRLLYNAALEQRIMAWEMQKKSINVYEQKRELPQLKEEMPEYKKVYNKYLSETLFRLDEAFKGFYQRCKKNDEAKKGFPRFRGKHYFFTLTCPAMYVKKIDDKTLQLPQKIIIKTYEAIPDNFKEIHIVKQKNDWYITFAVNIEEQSQIKPKEVLGIDLGLKKLVTAINTSNKKIEYNHIKPGRKELNRLDNLRSKRDKCIKFSRRWKYLTKRLKDELSEWRNRCIDWLHKVSYQVIKKTEGIIVIGKLLQNTLLKDNRHLNRYIQNEWRLGKFKEFLKYKCKKFGRQLEEINEAYTTQDCFQCGNREKKSLSQRTHKCECGFTYDRDINSALNILKRFLLGLSHQERNKLNLSDFWLDVLGSPRNLNIDMNTFVYI